MRVHEQLCLRKNPKLAAWAAILFGVFGLIGLTNLHHNIDVGLFARIAYLIIAATFIALLKPMTCAVERVLVDAYATVWSALNRKLLSRRRQSLGREPFSTTRYSSGTQTWWSFRRLASIQL